MFWLVITRAFLSVSLMVFTWNHTYLHHIASKIIVGGFISGEQAFYVMSARRCQGCPQYEQSHYLPGRGYGTNDDGN